MLKKNKKYYFKPIMWDTHQKAHFLLNILFGVLIALALHFFELTSYGNSILATEMDQVIKKEAINSKKIDSNIIFVDIDNETEQLWNFDESNNTNFKYSLNSIITRRDSLTSLLKKLVACNPRLIVLDMFFEFYSINPNDDSIFVRFLDDFNKTNKRTKIILPYPNNIDNLQSHNIYRHIINSKNILLGSASIASEFEERTIRYIYTYTQINNGKKLWSVPILAYCVLNDIDHNTLSIEKLWEHNIKVEDENPYHSKGINFLSSRIRFLLTPTIIDPKNGEIQAFGNIDDKPDIRYSGLEITSYLDGGIEPYFPDSVLKERIKNKIVVVGNSTQAKGDIHLTPIGEIPGMYILGNAVNTIINTGLIKSPPLTIYLFIELLTIIICAYLFLYLEDIIASILGFIIIGVPLSYASYYIFIYTGFFLTSTFALIGIAIHKIIIDVEKLIDKRKHKEIEKQLQQKEHKNDKIHFNI